MAPREPLSQNEFSVAIWLLRSQASQHCPTEMSISVSPPIKTQGSRKGPTSNSGSSCSSRAPGGRLTPKARDRPPKGAQCRRRIPACCGPGWCLGLQAKKCPYRLRALGDTTSFATGAWLPGSIGCFRWRGHEFLTSAARLARVLNLGKKIGRARACERH